MSNTSVVTAPKAGTAIARQNGRLVVPDDPIIPFIEGDGTGPDIWRASVRTLDAAVAKAYGGKKQIAWMEVYAGEKSFTRFKNWLPDETLHAFRTYLVGIKGPLTTPVGGGIRSLNGAMRQILDLYACLRPVGWLKGVQAPVKPPEKADMVSFRQNTADIEPRRDSAPRASARVLRKAAIADITLQQVLTPRHEFDVIATLNLNGDYLSAALAAPVGGIGIAPGGNINYVTGHAVFEATHGTAPKYANLDKVNPGSVILSGVMLLEHLGWAGAAARTVAALEKTIAQKTVTYDFARLMEGAKEVSCSAFGDALISNIRSTV